MPDLWHAQPILVIDVETTGLIAGTDKILELAAVRFEGGVEVAAWSSLVNPGVHIEEKLVKIHGIDDEMVKDAPGTLDAMDKLRDTNMHLDAWPAAYNAPFDYKFWFASSPTFRGDDGMRILDPDCTWLDPLVMIRHFDRYVSGRGRHKLTTTCKRWEVELENAHRAENDARAAGRLLQAVAPRLPAVTMEEILVRQEARRSEQEQQRKDYKKGRKAS